MLDVTRIVDDYVAVWNEADPGRRRERIRALWAPEGTTCNRLLDARGYEAIEARVAGSWEKWLRDGNYAFRPKTAVSNHAVVKVDWEMVAVPGGRVEGAGRSFLVLDPNGRVDHDYQFNPAMDDAGELPARWLSARVEDLWAPDGLLVTAEQVWRGHREIAEALGARNAAGRKLSPAGRGHAHHDVAWLDWHVTATEDDRVVASVCHLLRLEASGRVGCAFEFEEPAA
jgi:hypothetical protein